MNLTIMPNYAANYRAKTQQNTRVSSPATSFGQDLNPEQIALVKKIGTKIRELFPATITSDNLEVTLSEEEVGRNFLLKALKPTPEGYTVKAQHGPACCGTSLDIRDENRKGWSVNIAGDDIYGIVELDGAAGTHPPKTKPSETVLTNALKALLG